MNIYSGVSALVVTDLVWSKDCGNALMDGSAPYYKSLNPTDGEKEVVTVGHNNMPPFYILYYIMKL
jgi:hypothetical protein